MLEKDKRGKKEVMVKKIRKTQRGCMIDREPRRKKKMKCQRKEMQERREGDITGGGKDEEREGGRTSLKPNYTD